LLRIGGAKKDKKAKVNFVLRVRYNTSKQLANKFIAYAIPLAVFPCFANLALRPYYMVSAMHWQIILRLSRPTHTRATIPAVFKKNYKNGED